MLKRQNFAKNKLLEKQNTRPGTLFLWVAWRVLLLQIYHFYVK